MDEDAWDALLKAMKDVFGADKLEISDEDVLYRRNDEVFLAVSRDGAVEGAMPLHHVVLEDIEGVETTKDTITFHTADGAYTYHRPY